MKLYGMSVVSDPNMPKGVVAVVAGKQVVVLDVD
jgi:hypothetical protein